MLFDDGGNMRHLGDSTIEEAVAVRRAVTIPAGGSGGLPEFMKSRFAPGSVCHLCQFGTGVWRVICQREMLHSGNLECVCLLNPSIAWNFAAKMWYLQASLDAMACDKMEGPSLNGLVPAR